MPHYSVIGVHYQASSNISKSGKNLRCIIKGITSSLYVLLLFFFVFTNSLFNILDTVLLLQQVLKTSSQIYDFSSSTCVCSQLDKKQGIEVRSAVSFSITFLIFLNLFSDAHHPPLYIHRLLFISTSNLQAPTNSTEKSHTSTHSTPAKIPWAPRFPALPPTEEPSRSSHTIRRRSGSSPPTAR